MFIILYFIVFGNELQNKKLISSKDSMVKTINCAIEAIDLKLIDTSGIF